VRPRAGRWNAPHLRSVTLRDAKNSAGDARSSPPPAYIELLPLSATGRPDAGTLVHLQTFSGNSVKPPTDLVRLFARRSDLQGQLALTDAAIARAFESAVEPEEPDVTLLLPEAAAFMAEPVSTFRRRKVYWKALVSEAGERRRKYSRRVLEQIRRERLEANGMVRA
jgi:hypothetical protein